MTMIHLTQIDNTTMDPTGLRLAQALDAAIPDLPADIAERLRVARMQAVAVRKAETSTPTVALGHELALGHSGSDGPGFWRLLASLLPVLALLAGLVAMQGNQQDLLVRELAEIDAALLVDDLPPAAYSDPGFIQFLRHGPSSASQD